MAAHFSWAHRRSLSLGLGAALLLAAWILLPGNLAAASRTIVIDPGHGGFDRGGIPGQVVPEKTMALDVAQRLARNLRAAGYNVVMTRDSDFFVSLGQRVAIANSYRDGIFICIHFNSATRSGANGIETYYYHADSARLAANIHRQVVGGTTTENRGIRQRAYFVLRKTQIPAVLVECGFLTNPEEAHLALQSEYREQLAEKIEAGIMGKPAPPNRPVVAGLVHVATPFRDSLGYNDFVIAGVERPSFLHHSKSSRKKTSSKKSSSSSSKSKKKKKKTATDDSTT